MVLYRSCLTAALLATACTTQQPQAPAGLLCELLREPDAAIITDPEPEFSWIVRDDRRGAMQGAYQLLVASSESRMRDNRGDMWDTGKVDSRESINIQYAGRALEANRQFWWQVRTWDTHGEASPFSEPQMFRTGTFGDTTRSWPAQSRWVSTTDNKWLLENRQCADYQEVAPQQLLRLSDGHYFVDFGKAAFATLRLTLTSPADGDRVKIFLGERRTQDNLVHKDPGRSNIGFKEVGLVVKKGRHTYTLALPRHISHYPNSQVLAQHMPEVTPYRYAEIVQAPSQIDVNDVRQLVLYYYFDDNASSFSCSDDRLNQVWALCKYTLKATPFLALYADGNRERMPYEDDAYIQQLGHYSVDREFSVGRYTSEFLIFNPAWPT
jgi:hypothetical protein